MQKRVRSKLAGVALAVLVAGGAFPARAAGDGTASHALLGTGSALCSIVYGPLKPRSPIIRKIAGKSTTPVPSAGKFQVLNPPVVSLRWIAAT